MKSVGELLEELGFDKNGSPETQKAFLNHLMKTAGGEVVTHDSHIGREQKTSTAKTSDPTSGQSPEKEPVQLAFDIEEAS